VTTDHFSVIIISFVAGLSAKVGSMIGATVGESVNKWWNPPPPAIHAIHVPHYKQGQSLDCVAVSVQMACKAVKPSSAEIWRLMEGAKISGDGNEKPGPGKLRYATDLAKEIKARTGVEPKILLWQPLVELDLSPFKIAMSTYIRRALADGHPVVLNSSALKEPDSDKYGHAVVLVGYDDKGNFDCYDPKGDKLGISRLTDVQLGISPGLGQSALNIFHSYTTIEIPADLDSDRGDVTINIPSSGAWFVGPLAVDNPELGPLYAFTWDGREKGGVGWMKKDGLGDGYPGTIEKAIGGEARMLFLGNPLANDFETSAGGLEVINADPYDERQVSVKLRIFDVSKGNHPVRLNLSLNNQPVSLGGNAEEFIQKMAIPPLSRKFLRVGVSLSPFHSPDITTPQDFRLLATLLDGRGAEVDRASFEFTLEPDLVPPLEGKWSGDMPFDEDKEKRTATLVIEKMSGQDFTGGWQYREEDLGLEGKWNPVMKNWDLTRWDRNENNPVKLPMGQLSLASGGRLKTTTPPCEFKKLGLPYDTPGDPSMKYMEDYMRKLGGGAPAPGGSLPTAAGAPPDMGKYGDVRASLEKYISSADKFVGDVEAAGSADEIAAAVNAMADAVAAMARNLNAHPELKAMKEPPAELAEVMKGAMATGYKMNPAEAKVKLYETDPKVQAAMRRMAAARGLLR